MHINFPAKRYNEYLYIYIYIYTVLRLLFCRYIINQYLAVNQAGYYFVLTSSIFDFPAGTIWVPHRTPSFWGASIIIMAELHTEKQTRFHPVSSWDLRRLQALACQHSWPIATVGRFMHMHSSNGAPPEGKHVRGSCHEVQTPVLQGAWCACMYHGGSYPLAAAAAQRHPEKMRMREGKPSNTPPNSQILQIIFTWKSLAKPYLF
jgi:hypothetical protein